VLRQRRAVDIRNCDVRELAQKKAWAARSNRVPNGSHNSRRSWCGPVPILVAVNCPAQPTANASERESTGALAIRCWARTTRPERRSLVCRNSRQGLPTRLAATAGDRVIGGTSVSCRNRRSDARARFRLQESASCSRTGVHDRPRTTKRRDSRPRFTEVGRVLLSLTPACHAGAAASCPQVD
jgi:hypothetical protein